MKRIPGEVYNILVEFGGANPKDKAAFINHWEAMDEWRFGGNFGFGGKFYKHNFTVSAYTENITKEIQIQIDEINYKLNQINILQCVIMARNHLKAAISIMESPKGAIDIEYLLDFQRVDRIKKFHDGWYEDFMDKCLSGMIQNPDEQIHNEIDIWHNHPQMDRSIAHFLGLTDKEYSDWLEQKVSVKDIIRERLFGISIIFQT